LAARISLALTLHNHQPVGNFGWVIAETFERAYLPMLEALERHPGVHLALHYTGPLLAWLRAERPEFIERLAALVESGQIEIVGGGWYEPVLAALPERDRVGQLVRMGDELENLFGKRPRGAWLAERVWEPDLPTSLVTAGYAWTVLDDAHFRAAAIPEEALWGPYTTDDQGKVLTVFGTEQGICVPTTSAGRRSGVNWMRWNVVWMVSASVRTVSVLASPGTPSSSTCPPVRRLMSSRSTMYS
jgi:alpha-amylase